MNPLKKIPLQWFFIGLGVVLYLFHFVERDPSDPYSRPIVSDAKGYYAYLPAIFIYQDLEYEFISEMDEKYYAVGHDKHIFIEVGGERVNKTFPGVALLYLPFFLVAHFLALLLGLEADGYSLIYQYLFDFGQFFYASLGLVLAGKLFQRMNFKNNVSLLSILVIVLGSNLWYYIIYDQSVTHIYNFFLITLMLYLLQLFDHKNNRKYLILSLLTFSLLLIIRPTGVLSIILIPFFFRESNIYKKIWSALKNTQTVLIVLLTSLTLFFIPLLLWKIQSGNWIVYSYGEEGFDFTKPHLIDFLFSYEKGWWLYSPVILISILLGAYSLVKKKKTAKITLLITFLTVSVYVFSSWWCWYYGFSFGQRVMVDFSLFYMYLLALGISQLDRSKAIAMTPVWGVLIFFNLHQSYQHYHGYYSTPTPTKEMYWDNFLSFQKKARVYLGNDVAIMYDFEFDFEKDLPEYSGYIVEHDEARSGKTMTMVDQNHEFSGNINLTNEWLSSQPVIIDAYVNAQSEIEHTSLIVEHQGILDTYRSYPLKEYISRGEWVYVSFLYQNTFNDSSDDIHIYFWNGGSEEKLYIDDVVLKILD